MYVFEWALFNKGFEPFPRQINFLEFMGVENHAVVCLSLGCECYRQSCTRFMCYRLTGVPAKPLTL